MEQKHSADIAHLSLAKYQFTCRARGQIILPEYKGPALYGGFGFSLKDISPFYHKQLCGAKSRQNPYILLPPLDTARQYPPGHIFSFELTLVGNAMEYFPVCRDAFTLLGERRGLGKNRGKFDIIAIDSAIPATPDDSTGSTSQSQIVTGDTIVSARVYTNSPELKLHLITPLRLKANDKLLRETPSFAVFFARTIGRLNSLSTFYGDGSIIAPQKKHELLELAEKIILVKDNSNRRKLSRYSTRQKQWLNFDGLQGEIIYKGNFAPFWPYLALGEWLHVGGKVNLGLGKYVMEEKKND
ncbi:MAG TPA: CRISPR system precrRNA processing endoribonuclease RAMP protein Cas6 [Desulfocapsa sulfexigens]|nr:CRISPR system precrRNA processing endoribonuclease RAMP protein Cas6 [Desulfocapsa sulfexigens]